MSPKGSADKLQLSITAKPQIQHFNSILEINAGESSAHGLKASRGKIFTRSQHKTVEAACIFKAPETFNKSKTASVFF